MSNTKHRTGGYALALAAGIISVVCAALLLLNRQGIVDQMTVWQYMPSGEVASFADRSGMSDIGRFYYYASQPSLDSAQDFNKQCSRVEDSTAILGCYTDRRIYIYNVDNKQLDGIREVTAAHEMLHAAYERLSDSAKNDVNALLETEYIRLKDDKDFADRMSFYERTEPGQRDNELHSIIGTEVANISPKLEAHYATYFSNRSKVVDLHASYASVFARLQERSDQISAEMEQLAKDIETGSTSYNSGVAQLNQDINSFNARAEKGNFSSQAEFSNERARLTARAAALDTQRQSINGSITEYGKLRDELLTISSQSEALNKSIDSKLAPVPSV